MFKLIAFFAILAAAFAAPKPDPLTLTTYTGGIPLAYSNSYAAPLAYPSVGYNYAAPYASGYYNYYGASPYRNLYY